MNVPKKQICEVILQTKAKFPMLRVGQIIANATRHVTDPRITSDPYYISDENLLLGLKEMLEKYE